MSRLLALGLLAALAGCAAPVVKVPVAVPCVPAEMPPAPGYPDTDAALLRAPDAPERYRLMILGREARIARLGVLEPVLEACKETSR